MFAFALAIHGMEHRLDGDGWRLCPTVRGTGPACVPAKVPGGVWDNLVRAGSVGDPLYRDNSMRDYNATHRLDGWTLSTTFDVDGATAGNSSAMLEFSGVQGLATISLNGVKLLSTDSMFRTWRAVLPYGLLMAKGNALAVALTAASPPQPFNGAFPSTLRARDEADAWGWDWSPDLNPMALVGGVKLVVATAEDAPYVVRAFSHTVVATEFDASTKRPTEFRIDASVEIVQLAALSAAARGGDGATATLTLTGDWTEGESTSAVSVRVVVPLADGASMVLPRYSGGAARAPRTIAARAQLSARVPDVQLWWPKHYGAPRMHGLQAVVEWGGASASATAVSARVGFRSVALYTGDAAPRVPARADPALSAAYVGCFRDGNPFWGCAANFSSTCQHALPHHAATDLVGMTVAKCVALCAAQSTAAAAFPLAGVQNGGTCYCGDAIGEQCDRCMPLVGTRGDEMECGSPCAGDRSVACGGSSYMWGSNSVYNVSHAMRLLRGGDATEPPPPTDVAAAAAPHSNTSTPNAEGSGDSAFALVINGVKVFSRGANLVPFELLEATANTSYIQRTLQSVEDGEMNMLRVWGGGMYQGARRAALARNL